MSTRRTAVTPKNKTHAAKRPAAPMEGLLTIAQAAEWLGCRADTIRRMIARGELLATRYGPRMIRIHPDDLRAMGEPVTNMADLLDGDAA